MMEEEIEFTPFHYYDNKTTLERILKKPDDLVSLIDDASKKQFDAKYITGILTQNTLENVNIWSFTLQII